MPKNKLQPKKLRYEFSIYHASLFSMFWRVAVFPFCYEISHHVSIKVIISQDTLGHFFCKVAWALRNDRRVLCKIVLSSFLSRFFCHVLAGPRHFLYQNFINVFDFFRLDFFGPFGCQLRNLRQISETIAVFWTKHLRQ